MPADEQIVTAEPIETPTAVVETPAEPVEAPETSTETPPEPKTYTSWQEALKDAAPEELLKDDRIAGRIGQVAQKLAKEMAAQEKAADSLRAQQEADRNEDARLRNLRSDNPMAYANEMERRDASRDAIHEEARRQAAMTADVTGNLTEYVRKNFPAEVVASLAGKTYEGSYAEGVTAYIADITKASRDALRAEWEKTERPALRKQLLTELNGGEPPIDSSAGGGRSGRKQYNSNYEASVALQNDEITIAEYTRQHRQNGWR